jgi:cytochrome c oxidase subunit 1
MKIFSTHHRAVGFGYLTISVAAVTVGVLLSLAMRAHLAWPDWPLPLHGPILPEEYLALVTMHGTLMLFFVMTVAPQSGFGNLILPAQIGARRMAFPRINAAGMWLTAVALALLLAAFFVPGGGPIGGWTAYPPLSESALAGPGQGAGMDCWLASIAIFGIASTMSAVNTLTTIVKLRCEGMTWQRLPLTVWGWFTAALLSVIAFSVSAGRAAAAVLRPPSAQQLLPAKRGCHQRRAATRMAATARRCCGCICSGSSDIPEVYIAILPGMGLTSMVIANFARRRVFAYKLMIATTLLIGLLGILVWGHHMFVAGLNPFAGTVFSISSLAIALPASAKVLSWLATLWRSRPRMTTAMLFALGFVSLFITGGLSGPILAQPILDEYLHNTFFVVAHFHLIMAMAGVFGLFCATYYWFPLLFGKMLSERLGKIHFWGTLLGAYATFLPMHLTGLAGEPRHYAQLNGLAGPGTTLLEATQPLQVHITVAAIFLALAQIPFLLNLLRAWRSSERAAPNPWVATTLEWAPESEELAVVYREPCVYSESGEEFLAQWKSEAAINSEAE